MALLWMDGFDHYGGVAARMLDGVYAQIESVTLTTVGARTGPRCASIAAGLNDSGMRRVLPVAVTTVGFGFAFNINQLPTGSVDLGLGQVLDQDNVAMASLVIIPTGSIVLREGGRTGPILAQSAAETVLPGSFQHFECEFSPAGCEVRINGVTVLNSVATGIASEIAQLYIGGLKGYPKSGALNVTMLLDDLFARDGAGSANNTWIGDQKVYTRLPDEDGPEQDWTPSTGANAWPILDNVPPVDSEFISAAEAGKRTSVGMAAFPGEIVAISAVYTATRLWKTDAGNAKVAVDMISGASETGNAPHPLSTAPRWYGDMFESNPATGLPWLVTDINAAQVVIDRTE